MANLEDDRRQFKAELEALRLEESGGKFSVRSSSDTIITDLLIHEGMISAEDVPSRIKRHDLIAFEEKISRTLGFSSYHSLIDIAFVMEVNRFPIGNLHTSSESLVTHLNKRGISTDQCQVCLDQLNGDTQWLDLNQVSKAFEILGTRKVPRFILAELNGDWLVVIQPDGDLFLKTKIDK